MLMASRMCSLMVLGATYSASIAERRREAWEKSGGMFPEAVSIAMNGKWGVVKAWVCELNQFHAAVVLND